jgi:hypothetical protein
VDISWTFGEYLNFAACPDELACPQGFLPFVLSSGQMKLDKSLETLSEGHFLDIRGICGHFWTYLKFPAHL